MFRRAGPTLTCVSVVVIVVITRQTILLLTSCVTMCQTRKHTRPLSLYLCPYNQLADPLLFALFLFELRSFAMFFIFI